MSSNESKVVYQRDLPGGGFVHVEQEDPANTQTHRAHVTVERRHNAMGKLVSVSEAVVKLIVGGQRLLTVGEGNGPVNALDKALRKALGVYSEAIADLELADFKVRILNGGTGAVTRVLIESTDSSGDSWFTVGVSENIVDASFEALQDSIVYKLLRAGVKPPA